MDTVLADSTRYGVTEAIVPDPGRAFAPAVWRRSVDVCDFIQRTLTPDGRDASFVSGPTARCRIELHALLSKCAGLPPVRTAVVCPCDEDTLKFAVAAAEAGLIEPVLIGPAATICSVAALCQFDLRPYHLIGVSDDTAAEVAVTLARIGKVEAIMLGRWDNDGLPSDVIETEIASPDILRILGLDSCIAPGAEVPVLLTSHADDMQFRLACCAVVSLLAPSRRGRSLAAE